jgi:hypothetical protein
MNRSALQHACGDGDGSRPSPRTTGDQTQALLSAVAAAQALAGGRQMFQEPALERELLAGRFNQPYMQPSQLDLLGGMNPFLTQMAQFHPTTTLPSNMVAQLSQFHTGASSMADAATSLRLRAQATALLQEHAQKASRAAAERAKNMTYSNPLEETKSSIDPRLGIFNNTMNSTLISNNSALLNTLRSGLQFLPATRLFNTDQDESPRDLEEANERKKKRMEEDALCFLGSTTHEAKNGMYFDASVLSDPGPISASGLRRTRGGVTEPFPEKVHRMLTDAEANGNDDIISFFPHGRAFAIHDPNRFVIEILPKYVRQSQISSFQRQLNLYGFIRIASGPDEGGYYHELFLRGRRALCRYMRRVGVPTILSTGEIISRRDHRRARKASFKSDPDFYSMKPITIHPNSKDAPTVDPKENETKESATTSTKSETPPPHAEI